MIHENLHMRSIHRCKSSVAGALYDRVSRTEERAVEYMAQQICERVGVRYNGTYTWLVNPLKEIHSIIAAKQSEFAFAKKAPCFPAKMRYNNIEQMVNDYKASRKRMRLEVRERLDKALAALKDKDESK